MSMQTEMDCILVLTNKSLSVVNPAPSTRPLALNVSGFLFESECKLWIFMFILMSRESSTRYIPPLFPGISGVHMSFCDSASTTLVRAADIVANNIYHKASNNEPLYKIQNDLYVLYLP